MAQEDELTIKPRKRRVGKSGGDAPCCTPCADETLATEDALTLATLFRALADPTRVQIVTLLARHVGEVCACDITSCFNLDQSTIAHHLRLLREAGIIDVVRHGVWAYYFLRPVALQPVRQLLDNVTVAALAS